MATKQTTLRLGEDVLAQLDYLQTIAHKSQAAIVADLISVYYHAVRVEAFGRNLALVDDPQLVKNGGTIITVEEQRALKTVRDRLAGTWEDVGGREARTHRPISVTPSTTRETP